MEIVCGGDALFLPSLSAVSRSAEREGKNKPPPQVTSNLIHHATLHHPSHIPPLPVPSPPPPPSPPGAHVLRLHHVHQDRQQVEHGTHRPGHLLQGGRHPHTGGWVWGMRFSDLCGFIPPGVPKPGAATSDAAVCAACSCSARPWPRARGVQRGL